MKYPNKDGWKQKPPDQPLSGSTTNDTHSCRRYYRKGKPAASPASLEDNISPQPDDPSSITNTLQIQFRKHLPMATLRDLSFLRFSKLTESLERASSPQGGSQPSFHLLTPLIDRHHLFNDQNQVLLTSWSVVVHSKVQIESYYYINFCLSVKWVDYRGNCAPNYSSLATRVSIVM